MKLQKNCLLLSLITALKKKSIEVHNKYITNKTNDIYVEGIHFAYYEVTSSLNNQLIGFQINKKDINFEIDPDKDLLSLKKIKESFTKRDATWSKIVTEQDINFIMDLVDHLKENAINAKKEYHKGRRRKDLKFYEGILFGYYEVFKIIEQQLASFRVDFKNVKFDFDPDKELLIRRTKRGKCKLK